jgi:hypothetical protein
MLAITSEERRRRIGHRHFLAEPARTVEEVATAIVGIHSSDPVTAHLSVRARVAGFTASDLERALYDERSLLRMHGMRRTLFIVPVDLAAIMDAACTRDYRDRERRRLVAMLQEQEIAAGDPDRWLRRVEERTLDALGRRGQATAVELTSDVPELGLKIEFGAGKTWGGKVGVSTRVLFLLATQGKILRGRPLGTWISGQYRWACTNQWLGEPLSDHGSGEARERLVTSWLRAFGPGTLADIKWWTGWRVGDTRRALEAIGAVPVALESTTDTGFILADDDRPTAEPDPYAALLPALDSTVMGWKERGWFLGDHGPALFDRNGNAGPTIWWNGRIIGGWAQSAGGEIRTALLENVDREAIEAVAAAAAALESWFGETRITPRFRSPIERSLRES